MATLTHRVTIWILNLSIFHFLVIFLGLCIGICLGLVWWEGVELLLGVE